MRAHSEDTRGTETVPVLFGQAARFSRGMKRPDGRHWAGPPHSPLLSVTSSRNPFAVIARSVLADQLIPDGALVLLAILASLHRGKRPLTLSAKELAVSQGVMLSTHYDRRHRGIEAPRLLMADGNAAIWGAVRQVWPEAGEQRCWNHKMRNVLDRLPQREQSEAKDLLRAVVYAPSRAEAVKAREVFARRYRPWYPKAVDVLEDDWERMVAFYDFPEDHWKHLRTTNVVESPFAALRLRTTAAKRFKRVESATALIWKLLLVAEKRFRRLDAPHLLKDVFEARKFEDGKPVSTQRKNAA